MSLYRKFLFYDFSDDKNELILRSYNFPEFEAPPLILGFEQIEHDNLAWQSLTIRTKKNFTIQVMQLNSFRVMVERQLTNDSILVLLVMYPALGIMIWIIVGRGMSPISKVTNNVKKRRPHQLSPIRIKTLPNEIQPLIAQAREVTSSNKNTDKIVTA